MFGKPTPASVVYTDDPKMMMPMSPQGGGMVEMSNQKNNEVDRLITDSREGSKHQKNLATVKQLLSSGDHDSGGVEDGKITKAYFAKFLRLEQCCCVLTIIAGGISVIEYDLEFQERNEDVRQYNLLKIALVLLWTILIATCMTILMTFLRYQTYLQYLQARKDVSKKDTIFSNWNWVPLTCEILILAVIPYPWTWNIRTYFFNQVQYMEAYYHVNEILALIMTVRVVFVCRTLLVQTIWYSNRTQRVCNLYACEANYMFVIKSLMRSQPYEVIFSVMGAMIFLFGYALRICESPLARNDPSSNNLSLYSNTMWNIIITMTTVGYGDFFARTDLGRLIIFIVCIFGIFVISMMVVTLTNSLMATSLEGKAITVLERLQVRDDLIDLAATVITLTAKISISWRKGQLNKKQHQNLLIKLRKAMNDFKVTQRLYKSITNTGSLNEEMTREFDLVRSSFKEMMDRQSKIISLNQTILTSVKNDKLKKEGKQTRVQSISDLDVK